MSQRNARQAAQTIIADNRDFITENLNAFWHSHAEDMVAAGIDRARVADALFTIAVAHQLAVLGHAGLIEVLRGVADYHERLLMNSENPKVMN